MVTSATQLERIGLGYWMQQVLEQVGKVADRFEPDPVHDLRTALRRCRSIADGLMSFDSDTAWKKMKKAGKQLFQSLGAVRDTHVLRDWIERLAPENDISRRMLEEWLAKRELELRGAAIAALQQFDRSKWEAWAQQLPSRAGRIPCDSPLFGQLVLERWQEAHRLHHRALRNRTQVAYHDLRIGVKRFRYTVENLLPSLHEFWAEDLKEVQDALGDVHDLDVLSTMLNANALLEPTVREWWRERIREERQQCLERYRRKMVGKGSLWARWRAPLPKADELRTLGLQRFEIWTSFLDPDLRHSRHVAHLAVQLFDGLSDGIKPDDREACRSILQAAALMHNAGRSRMNKGHHKESARLIRKLSPPLGWTAGEVSMASLIARYHRGAMPSESHKIFSALPKSRRSMVQVLGGILRFACACDRQHDAQIRRVDVESSDPVLRVRADGYGADTSLAEHLAAARYLLEVAYHRPVFVMAS